LESLPRDFHFFNEVVEAWHAAAVHLNSCPIRSFECELNGLIAKIVNPSFTRYAKRDRQNSNKSLGSTFFFSVK